MMEKPSVFLLQAGRLSGNPGISGKQERSENADDNDVAEECECTLQEDLFGRLSIDGDVQNRSNENPCSSIGNDLNKVEQNDVLLVEAALFYRKFLCKSADCNADNSLREYPAPPYRAVKDSVTKCVAEQSDDGTDKRSEDCRQKSKNSHSGLQRGVRNSDRNLNLGQNNKQSGSDTDCNNFFDTKFLISQQRLLIRLYMDTSLPKVLLNK